MAFWKFELKKWKSFAQIWSKPNKSIIQLYLGLYNVTLAIEPRFRVSDISSVAILDVCDVLSGSVYILMRNSAYLDKPNLRRGPGENLSQFHFTGKNTDCFWKRKSETREKQTKTDFWLLATFFSCVRVVDLVHLKFTTICVICSLTLIVLTAFFIPMCLLFLLATIFMKSSIWANE
jgi:hypothetical protein